MSLEKLRERLARLGTAGRGSTEYVVPRLWIDPEGRHDGLVRVDPIEWWHGTVDRIGDERGSSCRSDRRVDWTRDAVVYSLFVRTATAFDHDGDGRVSPLNADGFRETGTFAKAIALLPYIRSLGCNTVHLLPISAIGIDGRKGTLGSPYAVRNPYRLDALLAEPALGLGEDAEFAAFVEAGHRLGLRVVLEFALRTAAKDSDWVRDHPEWFYWICDGGPLRSPVFDTGALSEIKERVARGERASLPAPPEAYRRRFVRPEAVCDVRWDGTRWLGRTADGGSACCIPGAFADWPPDDAQPAWSDVTYLRMYDHPGFEYMAYNTLRMYDERLACPENAVQSLWDRIVGVIPSYQQRFGIDGALIDMGHALPSDLKARVVREVRAIDPSFAFWGEEFHLGAESRAEGYDAVIGNCWWMVHRPSQFRSALLREIEQQGVVLPFFAAAETHNTPRTAARTGGVARSGLAWTLGCFLPAIPFVHSGFELGETVPLNTGLDFTPEEAAWYPEERLGLYNPMAFDWTRQGEAITTVRATLALRSRHLELVTDPSPGSLRRVGEADDGVVAYVRVGRAGAILVAGLYGGPSAIRAVVEVPLPEGTVLDGLDGRRYCVSDGSVEMTLNPWDAVAAIGRVDRDADVVGQ